MFFWLNTKAVQWYLNNDFSNDIKGSKKISLRKEPTLALVKMTVFKIKLKFHYDNSKQV